MKEIIVIGLATLMFSSSILAEKSIWDGSVKKDPLTDAKKAYLIGFSEDGKGAIRIYCRNDKLVDIVYFLKSYNTDIGAFSAQIRFDKNEPKTLNNLFVSNKFALLGSVPNDEDNGVFSKNNMYNNYLVDAFKKHNKFVIRVVGETAVFSLSGFTQQFNKSVKGCNFY